MDRDISTAIGTQTEASQIIVEADPKLYLPTISTVEIQADLSIICTRCGHQMQTIRKRHQGNDRLRQKGNLSPSHAKILSWWVMNNKLRDMSLLKSELHEEYNKDHIEYNMTFNPFQGRLSEMVGANLVIEGLQSPPLYRLNIDYVRHVLRNGGRLNDV